MLQKWGALQIRCQGAQSQKLEVRDLGCCQPAQMCVYGEDTQQKEVMKV